MSNQIQIINTVIAQLQHAIKENINDEQTRSTALLHLFEVSCCLNRSEIGNITND